MAGGVITTGNSPKALWPGIRAWWGREYNDWEVQYTQLFDEVPSDKQYEEYVGITGFGLAAVKPQGASITYDSELQGTVTRLTNITYALGYQVTMEEIDDNQYEAVSRTRATALARSVRQTKENVAALIYNRGFNSSYTGADGVSLFNTAHPTVSGNNFSNMLQVGADLSEQAIEDLHIQIMGATDDRGLTIQLLPQSLIIHRDNFYNAQRILKSMYQSGTANNDINVLKAVNAIPKIEMNVYLTAPGAWFIRTNIQRAKGMIYQMRKGVVFDMDNDFDNKNLKHSAYERYAFGWADPRAVYGSNGP